MGSFSIWHWLIVLAVVLLLFGGSSKISTLMGDFAKGIKSFKKNMGDDESMEAGAPSHGSIAAPGTAGPQVAPHYAGQPYAQPQPVPVYPAQPGQPVNAGPVTGTATPVEPQHGPG